VLPPTVDQTAATVDQTARRWIRHGVVDQTAARRLHRDVGVGTGDEHQQRGLEVLDDLEGGRRPAVAADAAGEPVRIGGLAPRVAAPEAEADGEHRRRPLPA